MRDSPLHEQGNMGKLQQEERTCVDYIASKCKYFIEKYL